MGLTKVERETGVLWNEAEDLAVVWTVSRVVARYMRRKYGEPRSKRGPAEEWVIPKSHVRLPVKPRVLSEEARVAAAARLRARG